MNKPQIRFEGFSGEWEQRELKGIAPLQRGFDLPKADIKVGNYPVVMSNGINGYHSEFKAKGPGVVTGRSGTIGQLNYIERDYWPHNTALWVTDFKNNNPKFIYHLYNKIDLSRFKTGSGVPTLNRNDVHDTTAFIPMNSEQKQISSLLSIIDNIIALHQQEDEKTKNFKKSMLQNMFPKEGSKIPEIRFGGFSGEWGERKLGIETQIIMGQSPNSVNYTNNPTDHILVQGNADMKNGYVIPRVWTSQFTKKADKDDLILSVRAPVGDVGKTDYDVVIGRGVAGIKGDEFIFQSLLKMKMDSYWDRLSTGSTFESINSNDIKNVYVKIPSDAKEREAIGNFFKNLDETISLQKKQIEHLLNIKTSLLEKVFV